jgi:tetratricopeptide (TPR) repeat protein
VLKQPAFQWWSLASRSVWTLLRGEFAEGERLAQEALRVGQRAQSWDAGFSYRIALFVLRREQGRLQEIDELFRESIDEYAGYRSFPCLVALIDCELGRRDPASRRFHALAADEFAALPRDGEWLFCLSVLSEVAAHLRDAEQAAVLYRLLLPYEQLNAQASGEISIGCVARYLGILASTISRWDDAARHFERALELNARMGARPWVARTQCDYADMLLARRAPGDTEQAELLLSKALATYQELGMRAAAAKASARTVETR